MIVHANGIGYQVEIHSQNPALPCLLLLHGFMGSGSVFEHLVQALEDFVNPVTLDLLGHGKTEGTSNPERYSLDKQMDDLKTIISGLNLDRPYLYGYSMGGRLALRYALAHPDTLTGLILESTNYGIEADQARKERLQTDAERAAKITDDFSDFLEQWNRLPLFDNGIKVSDHLQKAYDHIQRRQNPAFMAASLEGFGTATMTSVKNKLNRLQMPVMLLAGEQDMKYVEILSEMNARIPNSVFHVIEKAGHRVHMENPETLADRLRDFLVY